MLATMPRFARACFGLLTALFMLGAAGTAWAQISVPATSTTGVFTITWSNPAPPWEAWQYVVSESVNGAAAQTIHSEQSWPWPMTTSIQLTRPSGTYTYYLNETLIRAQGPEPDFDYRNSQATIVVTIPPQSLPPPANLAANATGLGNVTLSWSPVANATSYTLRGSLIGENAGASTVAVFRANLTATTIST